MLTGTINEWEQGPGRGYLVDTKEKHWDLYEDSFDSNYLFPSAGDKVTFEEDKETKHVAIRVKKA